MNHIRLLIKKQCGSHIIHRIPNPLAFQQNYSSYDGPSESGSFFTLSKPGLTSFLQGGEPAISLPDWQSGKVKPLFKNAARTVVFLPNGILIRSVEEFTNTQI